MIWPHLSSVPRSLTSAIRREKLVLLFLDVWTAGVSCVMTLAATSGECVPVCLRVCVWRILPHLGGSPAVPHLACLGGVLQTLSCHSRLPGAHLMRHCTCATTQPHLPYSCVCVCVWVWEWEGEREKERYAYQSMHACVQVRICVSACVQETQGTCLSSGLRLQSSHLSVKNTPRKSHQTPQTSVCGSNTPLQKQTFKPTSQNLAIKFGGEKNLGI